MKLPHNALIISLVLAVASGATAQQAQQKDKEQSKQQPSATVSEKTTDELKVTEQELEKRVSDVNKAKKFIGMQIKNTKNENVGKIHDLALDLRSGRIAYAVVSVGGFLGVGDKLVAVPIEALTVEKGAKHLLLDVDKPQIEQAAGFSDNTWPDLDAVESGKTVGFTARRTNETAAAGAAETQSDRTAGTSASRPAPTRTPGAITDLGTITASSNPAELEGKQVKLSGAKVDQVSGGNFILVVSDQGQHAIVKTPSGAEQPKPGQKVNLSGTIRKMESDAAQLGLDPAAAEKVKTQKVYIEATQLTPVAEQ